MQEILKSPDTYDVEVKYLPKSSKLILEQEGMYKDKDLIGLDIKQIAQLHAVLTQILLLNRGGKA